MALDIDDSVIDIDAVKQDIMVQQKKLARQKGEKKIIDLNVAPKKTGMTMLDRLKIYHAIIVNDDKLYKKLRYRNHDPMKVMIEILEKSIEKNDYVKATLEWRALTPRHSQTYHCTCNHGVGWDYPIKNRLNGNVVTLGSDCIFNYVGFDRKVAGNFAKTFHHPLNPDYFQQIDDRHKAWVANLNKAKEREKFRLFLEDHNLTMSDVTQMLTEFMADYDKYGCFMGNYLQLYKEGLEYITKEAYMTNTQFDQWQAYEAMDKKFGRKQWQKEVDAFKELVVYRRSRSYDEVFTPSRSRSPFSTSPTADTDIKLRFVPKLDNEVKMLRFILDHLEYDCYFKGQHPELAHRRGWLGSRRIKIYMNPGDADVCNDYFAMLETYQTMEKFPDIFKHYTSSLGVRAQTQARLECRWLKHEGKPKKDWLLVAKIERPKLDEKGQPMTDDKGKVEVEKTTMANLYKNELIVKPTEVLDKLKRLRAKGGFSAATESAARDEWLNGFIAELKKKGVSYYNTYLDLSAGKIRYLFTGINNEPGYVFSIEIDPGNDETKFYIRDTKNGRDIVSKRMYHRYDIDGIYDYVRRIDFAGVSSYTPPALKPTPAPAPAPVSTPALKPTPAPALAPVSTPTTTPTSRGKLMDVADMVWGKPFMQKHSLELVKVKNNTGIFEFTGTGRVPSKDWHAALAKLKGIKKNASVRKKYPKAIGRALQSRECSGGKSFSWCWVIQLEGKEYL